MAVEPATLADASPANALPPAHHETDSHGHRLGFWGLALGSIGVVFGDIGTSPLYAMREALSHARDTGSVHLATFGVVSLIVWALLIIVTLKYVVFIMRADNKGEGGTLALMALAQRAIGHRSSTIFMLAVLGAALFYGDGIITPAVSVLSAVEGLKDAPGLGHYLAPVVPEIAIVILFLLFFVQSRGTAVVARFFGPIMVAWFLAIAGIAIPPIFERPEILGALSPVYGIEFLVNNGVLGFVIAGSVFLAVTGAEALYADMGHFGRNPIRAAWLVMVFPCLIINYLGQGALVLAHPHARLNPFFELIPQVAYWPMVVLATVATVIASQAVISGAFSITQQGVLLGLLPRLDIRRTSESQAGQIFVPATNLMLLVGVIFLIAMFRTSDNLAAAYGIAVTGTMVITTLLAFIVARRLWGWSLGLAVAVAGPLLAIDLFFLASNSLKILEGGWVPLALGGFVVLVMWTWSRGSHILAEKTRKDFIPLTDLVDILKARAPHRAPGTAIFLTGDIDATPVALMHNLKHNKVLHEKNIILTVRTAETPRVREEDRVEIIPMNDDFKKIVLNFGFMETPNVPRALAQMRKRQGLKFDIMATSFFLGRRSVVASATSGMPLWQDKLYIFLMRNAANPTDFFFIPPGRVVELGAQVTV